MNMYGSTESVLTTESLDGYFTKHGKDKVFMTPHICIDFWAISAQGRIQPFKVKKGSSPKDFFFRVGMLQQQTECIAMINDLKAYGNKCCYFWFHSDV